MTARADGSASNRTVALRTLRPPGDVGFTPEEYRGRLDRVRDAMNEAGIDTLYLSAPESICYVCGHQANWYQGQAASDWHPGSGVAISCTSDHFIQFEDEDEAFLSRITSISSDVRVRGHDGDALDWAGFVCSELASTGWLGGTVGLEILQLSAQPGIQRAVSSSTRTRRRTSCRWNAGRSRRPPAQDGR